MSYDIYFWREREGAEIDPEQLLSELDDSVQIQGIVPLPFETLRETFRSAFPDVVDQGGTLEWEGENSYFQVGFIFSDEKNVFAVSVFCGYELLKNDSAMRQLYSVPSALGCRIYNPQQH